MCVTSVVVIVFFNVVDLKVKVSFSGMSMLSYMFRNTVAQDVPFA